MAVLGPRSLMAGKVSSTMEREVEVEGPDPDAIKMFVGQVPRSMDEVGKAYCILVEHPPTPLPSGWFTRVLLHLRPGQPAQYFEGQINRRQ